MTIEIHKEKSAGTVRTVTIGATKDQGGTRARTLTLGGETALPFLDFEGTLAQPAGAGHRNPRPQARRLVAPALPGLGRSDAGPGRLGPRRRRRRRRPDLPGLAADQGRRLAQRRRQRHAPPSARVLQATGLPLAVVGPGQADLDNELIVAVAEEAKGERLLIGICEDKNYRTIVAAALANDHLVQSKTPMDVNLSKQLVILIHDMGMPLERIVMDPTTGALGYGIEYGYSVMERLRLAALQGDSMTQQPMMVNSRRGSLEGQGSQGRRRCSGGLGGLVAAGAELGGAHRRARS